MAKICMIAYTFYPSDPRVRREAEALAMRGDTVDFICLQEPGDATKKDYHGVQLYRLTAGRYQGESTLAYLAKYIRFFFQAFFLVTRLYLKKRYDIIQNNFGPE